jgi:beta-galactosidase
MRLIYPIILLFLILSFRTNAEEKNSKEFTGNGTEKLSLCGLWQFSVDSTLVVNQVWQKPDFKSNKWNSLTVPGNWDTENDYANFVGTGYYRKEFKVPSNWDGSVIRLCFDAVYHTAEVWINGQYLGKHVGGYTPFEFDITKVIKPGKINTIALTANNEYQRGAWWHWGGISREVKLVRNNKQQIVSQQITSEPDLKNGGASVSVAIKIKNDSIRSFQEH